MKKLDPNHPEIDVMNGKRSVLETNLLFMGLLVFQDNVKKEAPAVVKKLKSAGVHQLMATGKIKSYGYDNKKIHVNLFQNCLKVISGSVAFPLFFFDIFLFILLR